MQNVNQKLHKEISKITLMLGYANHKKPLLKKNATYKLFDHFGVLALKGLSFI